MENKYELTINQKMFKVESNLIDGKTIKKLIDCPDNYSVVCQSKSKDYYVGNDEFVDLEQPNRNTFFTFNPKSTEG